MKKISIHALLTESDPDFARSVFIVEYISIHALLTESDFSTRQFSHRLSYFNPRSPHGERRWLLSIRKYCYCKFQSTLSSRRATKPSRSTAYTWSYFNPRSPHGERLLVCLEVRRNHRISIHALLTESDLSPRCSPRRCRAISIHALLTESDGGAFPNSGPIIEFQSTLSSRRATSLNPGTMPG